MNRGIMEADRATQKRCPKCRELIPKEASVCSHCRHRYLTPIDYAIRAVLFLALVFVFMVAISFVLVKL